MQADTASIASSRPEAGCCRIPRSPTGCNIAVVRRPRRQAVRGAARCRVPLGRLLPRRAPVRVAARRPAQRPLRARSARMALPAGRFTNRGLSAPALPERSRVAASVRRRSVSRGVGQHRATPAARRRIDYRREILLEAAPDAAIRPEAAASAIAAGAARILRYEAEVVEIETEASGRRLFMLTDTWFPGWSATSTARTSPSSARMSPSGPSRSRRAVTSSDSSTGQAVCGRGMDVGRLAGRHALFGALGISAGPHQPPA